METLQSEYLLLVSQLHIQEQILEVNQSHQKSDDHLRTPNLESEISGKIAKLKRQIAVKAMVLNSQKLEIPVHTLEWKPDGSKWRRLVARAIKKLEAQAPKVESPVMGKKVSKRKLPKITPRKVKIKP